MSNTKEYWDDFYSTTPDEQIPWHGGRVKLLQMIVDDLQLEKGLNVLEVGCGKGDNVFLLSKMGFDVDGIDKSEVAIKKAKEKTALENVSAEFFVEDMSSNEGSPLVKDKKYDVVFDLVVSQFLNPEEKDIYLQRLAKSIKPTGTFVLYTFSKDSEDDPLVEARPWVRNVAQSIEQVESTYGKYLKIQKYKKQVSRIGEKLCVYYMNDNPAKTENY